MKRSIVIATTLLLSVVLVACGLLTDTTPPEVSLSSPAGEMVQASSTALSATASDRESGIKAIQIYVDQQLVAEEQFTPDEEGRYELVARTLTASADLTPGRHLIEVVATNGVGRSSTVERSVLAVRDSDPNREDQGPPTVEWNRPEPNEIVSGMVPLSVFATDDKGVDRVEFRVNGQMLAEDSQEPYMVEWDSLSAPDGEVSLEAVAYDISGRSAKAGLTVQVRNQGTPPALDIVGPAGDSVPVQFTVEARVTRQATDFSWVETDGHELWVRLYDQVGHLVSESWLTSDGTDAGQEPSEMGGEGQLVRRSFDLSSFTGALALDKITIEVEGRVRIQDSELTLRRATVVDLALDTSLPPALLLLAPTFSPDPDIKPVFSHDLTVVGRVTDDSGAVDAIEFRMVCERCGPGGEDHNVLLYYVAQPYDLFTTSVIPTDGYPYLHDAENWVLRAVAIDSESNTRRNILAMDVAVDKSLTDPGRSASQAALEFAVGEAEGLNPPAPTTVNPKQGVWRWRVPPGPVPNLTRFAVVVLKDEEVVQVTRGFLPAGATWPINTNTNEMEVHDRTFGDSDVGTWRVEVVLQDTVTGVQVNHQLPSIGVEKAD